MTDEGSQIDSSKAAALKSRLAQARKGKGTATAKARSVDRPVGGVPEVSIPRLDDPSRAPTTQKQRMVQPPPGAGVGSAYSANRERSFGVDPMAEQGVSSAPAAPHRKKGQLSNETLQGIENLAKAQDGEVPTEVPPGPPEDETSEQEPTPRDDLLFPAQSKEEEELQRTLMNQDRRRAIESRCKPLNFDDFVEHFELRQRVPIIPGKFEPMFRTPSGAEDLWVKKRLSRETGSEVYVMGRYSMMQLALALVDINGSIQFPAHVNKSGEVDDSAFDEKLAKMLRLPTQMLNDLSINYMWFDIRARRMLTVDQVKNG